MANKKKLQRRAYSVLLLYPDYLSDAFGQETYFAHVKGKDAKEAVTVAQLDAAVANKDANEPEDFFPLAVFRGHLQMEACQS